MLDHFQHLPVCIHIFPKWTYRLVRGLAVAEVGDLESVSGQWSWEILPAADLSVDCTGLSYLLMTLP